MRIGLLLSYYGPDIEKLISDINSLALRYDARLVFAMKSFSEIRMIERQQEEI